VGLNDNGGNRLGLGEGIIGLAAGDCLGEESVAFDFFLPNESKFRRGFSSSDGRLNSGGCSSADSHDIKEEDVPPRT
jgi:hypothetical protein